MGLGSVRTPATFVSDLREKSCLDNPVNGYKPVLDGFRSPGSAVRTVAEGLLVDVGDAVVLFYYHMRAICRS